MALETLEKARRIDPAQGLYAAQHARLLGELVLSEDDSCMPDALAAYQDGQQWLDELLVYLQENREFLLDYVAQKLPGIEMARPEGTYLAWLDCSKTDLPAAPHEFFLEHARVALNEGAAFGPGGEGFVRLNFGCPRCLLEEGLERMRKALTDR